MVKPIWVLEKGREDPLSWNSQIREYLDTIGYQHHTIDIIPFSREINGPVPKIDGPVVAYGSTAIDTVIEREGWSPGVWRSAGLRESAVKAALGDLYMNADMQVVPVREAAQVALDNNWEFFFVKPNCDEKQFAGTVTDPQRYPSWIEGMLACEWIAEDFEVGVSPILDIGIEWRLPVVDSKVVDWSIYRQYRQYMPAREIYQDVLDVAAAAIARHDPAPVYTIDIGQALGKLKVIEYNGFNSAGMYSCKCSNVVDAINAYMEKTYV